MAENNAKKRRFFRETKSEIKKVSWPSRSQIVRNTAVILAFVVIMTVILYTCDGLLKVAMDKLLSLFRVQG